MKGRGLSIFLVILAIFFDAEAKEAKAAREPKDKSCSKSKNCKKCLNNPECAWQIDPEFTGCIEISECDSDEIEEGKCIVGKKDIDDYNEYACGKTCSTQSEATCQDCLDLDIFGNGKKKSDCAWFVKPGSEPKCIYRKECNNKGFEGGECIKGKKKRSKNSETCDYKEPVDKCEKHDDCKKCLNKDDCAWYDNGTESGCIAEDRCDDKGFETIMCQKGSETTDSKDTCKKMEKLPEPNPGDLVGFEKCSDFNEMCTDCLINGCFWVNANKGCYESCDQGPMDVGCSGTKPPVSIDNFTPLKYDTEASRMCHNFKLDDKNDELCGSVEMFDCGTCVETQIYPAPGEFYVVPPTCQYSPDTGSCFRECPPMLGGCTSQWSQCSIPEPPVLFEEIPPVGEEFFDLLGEDVKAATLFLEETYGPELEIPWLVFGVDYVTKEIRENRIRLWTDEKTEKIIVVVPMVG